jgi:pimeloyl-ACP methyl ester carboxylesterase
MTTTKHPLPFVHEAGTGPSVVCLHSGAGSSMQWLELSGALSSRFRVLAPDLWGSGRSPRPPAGMLPTLSDEIDLLAPAFAAAGERFFIVGHSYGAAVALLAAVRWPSRVAGLALYEPTLFSLLEHQMPEHPSTAGIRAAGVDGMRMLEAGDALGAGRRFIDFWMGEGSWDRMPASRQARAAETMANLPAWTRALQDDPTPVEALADLRMPILLMRGALSPQSSQAVADVLSTHLHMPELITFEALGHMAPLTHAPVVNAAVAAFLDRHAQGVRPQALAVREPESQP